MPRRNLRVLLIFTAISLLCQDRFSSQGTTFVRALEEIHAHYLEPVDREILLHAALRGMTSRLDPYSEYIPPAEYAALQQSLEQHFGGIGIQIGLDPKTKRLTVISPMFDTPAYRAGVLAGDEIIRINGKDTKGFRIEDAADLLRGRPGTSVSITVQHVGTEEPIEVQITRSVIKIATVLGDSHNADGSWNFALPGHPKIGYIRIVQFGERTVDELRKALERLRRTGMECVILDLRNDPGGLLEQAVATCNLFIDKGPIVSTRGRNGVQYEAFSANGSASYLHFPMAVLVNHFSASASEIVAACLQDRQRAVVVGERTWGKGSVQNLIPLEGGRSGLKLTTLSYWRPSGKNIHRLENSPESADWGVVPDPGFEVKLDKQQFERLLKSRRDRDIIQPPIVSQESNGKDLYEGDPQLRRAYEYVSEQRGRH